MLWNHAKLIIFIEDLNTKTNELAEEVKDIKEKMRGKGIYPAESPIIIERLQEIENSLRTIGSNKDYPLG